MTAVARTSVIIAAATMIAATGCSSRLATPRIEDFPEGSGGTINKPNAKGNTPYAFDDMSLCLTKAGSVTVEKVDASRPTGGLRVQNFALRPSRTGDQFNYVSNPGQRLTDVGYPSAGPMTVNHKCPKSPDSPPNSDEIPTLLGIEVVKPSDKTASTNGFVVTYRSDGDRFKMYVPFGIILCKGETEAPECQHHPDLVPPDDM